MALLLYIYMKYGSIAGIACRCSALCMHASCVYKSFLELCHSSSSSSFVLLLYILVDIYWCFFFVGLCVLFISLYNSKT